MAAGRRALYLLANEKINKENLWLTAGFFLVMFVYLNILRERFRYGDYHYYLEAAIALSNGQPLPDTYLYLPLWATLLQFIVSLGDQGVMIVLWILNIIALAAFYFLLLLFYNDTTSRNIFPSSSPSSSSSSTPRSCGRWDSFRSTC
jgi:hypothetical protein